MFGVAVREARSEELDWINQRYAAVGFPVSTQRDTVVIAELDGERAACGRLVRMRSEGATGDLELGGILVLEAFRSRGIARRVVEELLRRVDPGQRVFCLPFAHLRSFYESFGFRDPGSAANPPAELIAKLSWCAQSFEHETLLLMRAPEQDGSTRSA